MLRTSFIKTSALGLAVASTSLFAEATYTPNKYQQNDWFAEFGGNTWQPTRRISISRMTGLPNLVVTPRCM